MSWTTTHYQSAFDNLDKIYKSFTWYELSKATQEIENSESYIPMYSHRQTHTHK